ncbi:MAG: nucleoside recognition domain-containing protein [Candidatus Altiarchaeota archaeon]
MIQKNLPNGDKDIRRIEEKATGLKPKNFKEIFKKASKQSWEIWLLMIKIYIPIAFLTVILKQIGVIDTIAQFFSPVMSLLGLPGETSITLIAGSLNTVYAAAATLTTFELNARELTILAVVVGISHSLILETAILKKLKTANERIALFRFFMGIFVGILMNLLLPRDIAPTFQLKRPYISDEKFSWLKTIEGIFSTCIQIFLILSVIMLIYEIFMFFRLSKIAKKLMAIQRLSGISYNAFPPWIVGLFIGLLYGAGLLFQFEKNKKINKRDGCLLTIFLVLAHAIIEDTMIFAVLGANFFWAVAVRISIAFLFTRILATRDLYKKFLWIGLNEKN